MKYLEKALEQARVGRIEILNEMNKTIDKPSSSVKPHAPKMVKMIIDGDYIGAVIGPGGKSNSGDAKRNRHYNCY